MMSDASLLEQIKYFKSLNQQVQVQYEKQKSFLPKIYTKSEIFEFIKKNKKVKWKLTGKINREFHTESKLPAKLLSTWEISRIGLAERSYIPSSIQQQKHKQKSMKINNSLPLINNKKNDLYKQQHSIFRPIWKDELIQKVLEQKAPFVVSKKQNSIFGFGKYSTRIYELIKKQDLKNRKLKKIDQ